MECFGSTSVHLSNTTVKILDIETNIPLICGIKVYSNGGATYIIGEIIAMQFENIAD